MACIVIVQRSEHCNLVLDSPNLNHILRIKYEEKSSTTTITQAQQYYQAGTAAGSGGGGRGAVPLHLLPTGLHANATHEIRSYEP